MKDDYWLQEAKKLVQGKRARLRCCKGDRSMLISNTRMGYSGYCFRCGFNGFKPHGKRSISQVVQDIAEKSFVRSWKIQLPDDYIPIENAPDEAKEWFLKYGITLSLAGSYHCGYSKKMDRVILPVFNGKILQYVQARALDGRKPKYLNLESPASHIIFWSHNKYLYGDTLAQKFCGVPNYCVLTEDMLSTIKVGELNMAGCALGTNFTAEKAVQIASEFDAVAIWTDNDPAGERGRRQAVKELQMQGVQCIKHIHTPKDPKEYSYTDIHWQLSHIDWRR